MTTLFCDTSALIKLYFHEPQSDALRKLAADAETIGACRIAWAEVHAAFARVSRRTPDAAPTLGAAKIAFATDWPNWFIVDVTQQLVEEAGDFAEAFALRGYDSVQLAAARTLSTVDRSFSFASFDAQLNRAARILGLHCRF